MSDAIGRLINLPRQQRAAVLAELRQRAGVPDPDGEADPIMPRSPETMPVPASYLQEQLLFLDRWQPGTAAYHIPFQFRLRGPLDVAALQTALTQISERHEVLRTVLGLRRGQPVQYVRPPTPVDLPVVDLARVESQRRVEQAEQLAREAAHAPFDLATGPLVRVRLFRLADDDHLLVWVAHHAVADGWSLSVLVEELAAGYRRPDNRPPPLPVQFADYVLWQRDQLAGSNGTALVEFWRERLADRPGTELPTDHPRPESQTFVGAMHHFTVPMEVAKAARALATDCGATLFITLLAVYQALLVGWAGDRDVIVGTSVAGRTRPELSAMIGPLLNVVVLRDQVDISSSLRDLIDRARRVTLDVLAHQDLPFGQLVRHLAPARDGARNPVFQTMFDLGGGIGGAGIELDGGLNMTVRSIPLDVSQMDIAVVFEEMAGETGVELVGRFEYRTDLYRASTVRRLATSYLQLLESLLAEPDRAVAETLAVAIK